MPSKKTDKKAPNISAVTTLNTPLTTMPLVHTKTLNVPLLPQLTSMWCWAASAQMVMKYMGHDVTQCKQANHALNRTDCCNSPIPNACVKGGWPEFPVWKFASQTTSWGIALTFSQLVAQIDANKPFCFSWGWQGGGGHMMVVRGYSSSIIVFSGSGNQMVYINDPWAPNQGNTRWITYADFVAKAGDHVHWLDYYNIKYTGLSAIAIAKSIEEETPTEKQQPIMNTTSTTSAGYADPETAAREALNYIPLLVTTDNAKEMGFDSIPRDPSVLALGQPLPIYYIRHNTLTAHYTGQDVRKLLTDGEEMLYPVFKDGQVVCSVVVAKQQGVWAFRSLGDSNLVKELVEVRNRQASVSGKDHSKYFIVHIPSLYHMFVAHYDSAGKLLLSHLHDNDNYGFVKHASHDAERVINTILPHAKSLGVSLPGEA